MTKYIDVNYQGQDLHLVGGFYQVFDFMGDNKSLIYLGLETPEGEPYADLTKSFGEFVGQYGALFADINNCPGIEDFLQDNQIAFPTGGYKTGGYVTYPAYRLSPYIMEKLFSLEQIKDYKLEFDYMGEHTIEDELSTDWVTESLEAEKESFDEYLEQMRQDNER
ncbi:MAG: DUF4313 domain-containing protein [Clostridiales bacterium]|nr:DUF4313 domain-containing protein [Clostridiales bacterium]